jgi:hypothetical protein
LPDGAMILNAAIDRTRRRPFDCLHDLDQRNDRLPLVVSRWRQYQMNVVGHHHRRFKAIPRAVIVDTTSQHNIAGPVWQDAAELGAKRDEVRRMIALHMRQVAAVELHSGILPFRRGDWNRIVGKNKQNSQNGNAHGGADAFVRPGSGTALDGRISPLPRILVLPRTNASGAPRNASRSYYPAMVSTTRNLARPLIIWSYASAAFSSG